MKKIYLLLIGLFLCFTSQSQLVQFSDSLMWGGRIHSFAKNSSCAIVATDGGLFKTTNQGQNWTNVSKTFDPSSVSCKQIFSLGNDFYAASNNGSGPNVYKSNDNGTNWSPISFTNWWPQSLGKLNNTLYAIGGNWMGGYLYSSIDGSNWTQKAMLWNNNWQGGNCELLSFNQNKLYIAYSPYIMFTTDGNTLDTISTNGLGISDFSNYDTKVQGDASGNIYYNINNALYKYNFISKSWSDISSGKIAQNYQINEFSVTDNAIFIVAMNSSLGMKLYRSTNQGSTFTDLSTGLMLPMITRIMELSSTGFIGNWLDERIMISSNGGTTWSWTTDQFISTFAGNLSRSGNSLLYTREIQGVISTANQGVSWGFSNNGIPNLGGIAYFADEIIAVKDTLFAFVRSDPFNDVIDLYKSVNAGNQWIASSIPPPYNTGEEYFFAGKSDSVLFVSYYVPPTNDYALIATFNNGNTWLKPNNQNTATPCFLKGPKNCIFSFLAPDNNNWDDFSNVSKTTNFGGVFFDLNTSNLFNSNFLIKRIYNSRGDKGNAMMDFDEINNKAIFCIRDRSINNGIDRLYLYNISTNNWNEINTLGLPANYISSYIKYLGNNVWLLATTTGLYKSTDGGVTWLITHNINDWQQGIMVSSIQMLNNKAFMGTLSNGVWMLDFNTGILEQFNNNDIQIFPNPASDYVMLKSECGFSGNDYVEIIAVDGKSIVKQPLAGSEVKIDIRNLSKGIYLAKINKNNKMIINKITKQ